MMNNFKKMWIGKGLMEDVSKPGPSIHTPEWDACVAEMQSKPGINAYAVCTAQLGEESFKPDLNETELKQASQELHKAIESLEKGDNYGNEGKNDEVAISKLPKCPICGVRTTALKYHMQENHPNEKLKTVDTSYAGDIPKSGLAEQDLETTKSFVVSGADSSGGKRTIGPFSTKQEADAEKKYQEKKKEGWKYEVIEKATGKYKVVAQKVGDGSAMLYYVVDSSGAKVSHKFANKQDADEDCKDWNNVGKSVASTTKQLDEVADKAEDAETKKETQNIVESIKTIQLKRQKAVIDERKTSMKSFKDGWNNLNKGGPGSDIRSRR